MLGWWAAAALAAPLATVEPAPIRTAILDVAVLARDGSVSGPFDVLLVDGTIHAVAPPGEGARFPAEVTVDGRGRTLLPGLVDAHVHVGGATAVRHHLPLPNPRRTLAAMAFAGVTTALDLSAPRPTLKRWRRALSRRWTGPTLYGSGLPFDSPDGHGKVLIRAMYPGPLVRAATAHLSIEVTTAAEVDDALARHGAVDVVKVMLDRLPESGPTLTDEALARVRLGATALGVPLVAHVGRVEDLERAVALPADLIAHAPYFGVIPPATAERIAAAGVPVTPTLAVWEAHARVTEGRPFLDGLERAILPARVERHLERVVPGDLPDVLLPWSTALVERRAERADNVATLRAAGVALLVGSDAPGSGLVAGAGLHREIDLLLAAGVPPAEVFAAVTWGNARALDPGGRFGAVEAGWEADLLLIDGDLGADPQAIHHVVDVWIDGRRVVRAPVH